jgi:hypothetical protein
MDTTIAHKRSIKNAFMKPGYLNFCNCNSECFGEIEKQIVC